MTKHVVVGVDGSDGSRTALVWAFTLARRLDVQLQVVSAWQFPGGLVLPIASRSVSRSVVAQEAEHEVGTFVTSTLGEDAGSASVDVVMGSPVLALVDRVSSDSVLVVGSRGRGGLPGLLLGSVSRECVEHAGCPVVVVRGESRDAIGRGPIVVGVDLSDDSARAVEWALAVDEHLSVGVSGVYAWNPPQAELRPSRIEQLREDAFAAVDQWMEHRWPSIERVEVDGDPRRVLQTIVEARDAPLLVLGRRGAGDLAPLRIGSVASHLVTTAPTAVAVVPRR